MKNLFRGFLCSYFIRTMTNNKTPKTLDKFFCEKCAFVCSNKKDYNKHLATRKHQCSINSNKCNPINPQNENLTCLNCEKIYKSRVGLWRHKKKCESVHFENNDDNCDIDANFSAETGDKDFISEDLVRADMEAFQANPDTYSRKYLAEKKSNSKVNDD